MKYILYVLLNWKLIALSKLLVNISFIHWWSLKQDISVVWFYIISDPLEKLNEL